MTRPSPSFDLSVEDVDLIEAALTQSRKIWSDRHLSYVHRAQTEEGVNAEKARQLSETLSRLQDLLGRLDSGKTSGGRVSGLV